MALSAQDLVGDCMMSRRTSPSVHDSDPSAGADCDDSDDDEVVMIHIPQVCVDGLDCDIQLCKVMNIFV